MPKQYGGRKCNQKGYPREWTAELDLLFLRKSWEISQADKGAEGRAGARHRGQSLKASKGLRRGWEGNIEWEMQDSHYVGIMTVKHKNHPKNKVVGHPTEQVRQEWISVRWLGCWSSWLRELQGQKSVCDNLEVNWSWAKTGVVASVTWCTAISTTWCPVGRVVVSPASPTISPEVRYCWPLAHICRYVPGHP